MKKQTVSPLLVVAALGVVFGDIGTSPLYALQAAFGLSGLLPTPAVLYGLISLILWSITLVVTVKYVLLMTRADNHGEGGIMALIAKVRSLPLHHPWRTLLILLGILGVSLFYGDSVITPAISVLSAVEGTKLFAPTLVPYIVPLSLLILLGLFLLQARGSGATGRIFGPIMALWFIVSALGGLHQILRHPESLQALLPTTALQFAQAHPFGAFLAMGAVILAITGAEALYADMGHFGRRPISLAWLLIVFPALGCVYLGQGALVAHDPTAISSAYFLLFPSWLQLPVTILATLATVIASQAVLAGAFSITRQAIHLGLLPRMAIIHTSSEEAGQVFLPFINWLIAALVALIVVGFRSSEHLAGAFGFAISGVLAIDTVLFLVIVRHAWRVSWPVVTLLGLLLVPLDILFLSSSSFKFLHGAWLPLLLCLISLSIITTWHAGHTIILRERKTAEGTLDDFVTTLATTDDVVRVPGSAVYLGSHANHAPLALHTSVDQLHELHQHVIVMTVTTLDVPHVPLANRAQFDNPAARRDGITHATLEFGFKDTHNIPAALAHLRLPIEETGFSADEAVYFVSETKPLITRRAHRFALWRKYLYASLSRNSAHPSDYYHLPPERTIIMTAQLPL